MEGVAVLAVIGLVRLEHALHAVLVRRDVCHVRHWVTEVARVDGHLEYAHLHVRGFDILAENLLGVLIVAHQVQRLVVHCASHG
jgi:hypothetical protein